MIMLQSKFTIMTKQISTLSNMIRIDHSEINFIWLIIIKRQANVIKDDHSLVCNMWGLATICLRLFEACLTVGSKTIAMFGHF